MRKTAVYPLLLMVIFTLFFSLFLQTIRFLMVTESITERVYAEESLLDGDVELLQREVDTLYRQSREVSGKSTLNEIMHSVGYSQKGEQVFIFPRDISPDIPQYRVPQEPERIPWAYRVLMWIGSPSVSILLSFGVSSGTWLIISLVRRYRKKRKRVYGNNHIHKG
ncbi:MAG: hypothetical protein JXK93_00255 [Sphaerochaetaceae bacterium]|nr:hypothetical protein [Sphaerochaetaceae bacterium]